MNEILQLEPHDLWYYFSEISKIPHPSKHEKEIANYIYHLLSKKGLDCKIDPSGNVIARKKALLQDCFHIKFTLYARFLPSASFVTVQISTKIQINPMMGGITNGAPMVQQSN